MGKDSKIEWTDHTFNPWWGCTKVSHGCKFCYADVLAGRYGHDVWGPKAMRRQMSDDHWKQPLKWNVGPWPLTADGKDHRRPRVFCASMADVFEGPETCQNADAYAMIQRERLRLFDVIRQTPNLDWLLLTKRPQNVDRFIQDAASSAYQKCIQGSSPEISTSSPLMSWLYGWCGGDAPSNVWIGTSVEDQYAADKRIPELQMVPAVVRFLSCEPLIGPVVLQGRAPIAGHPHASPALREYLKPSHDSRKIHWVIVGGESGANARPMHPAWAQSLRDQCVDAGVPVFFKQHGEYLHESQSSEIGIDPDTWYHKPIAAGFPNASDFRKIGKKAAGRVLDGRTWDEFPEVAA